MRNLKQIIDGTQEIYKFLTYLIFVITIKTIYPYIIENIYLKYHKYYWYDYLK